MSPECRSGCRMSMRHRSPQREDVRGHPAQRACTWRVSVRWLESLALDMPGVKRGNGGLDRAPGVVLQERGRCRWSTLANRTWLHAAKGTLRAQCARNVR